MADPNYGQTYIRADICASENCRGCAACVNICPQKCIKMGDNEYGESIPYVLKENCIECKLCHKVCIENNVVVKEKPQLCYAGWRKDFESRINSSSGGIASLIAEYYFDNGWDVFGTIFDRDNGAYFVHCESISDIKRLKGSKYVQSFMNYIYKDIEQCVKDNHRVVFFGMPCQVAALKRYLLLKNTNVKNVLFVDFLCHGVVPGVYLNCEIESLEKKNKCDNISFRGNRNDDNYYLCLYENNKVFYRKKAEFQRYFYMFLNSISIREGCFNCSFKTVERVGDLTLGDFIGLGARTDFTPNAEYIGNPSLIFVNSIKGESAIKMINDEIYLCEREIDEAVVGGPSLRGNIAPNNRRLLFRKLYPEKGYYYSAEKVTRFPILIEKMKYARNSICTKIKKVIKKVLRIENARKVDY